MNPFHAFRLAVLKFEDEREDRYSFVYCFCTQAHSLFSGKGVLEVLSALGSSKPALWFVVALLFVLAELLNFSLIAVPLMALIYALKTAEMASMIDNLVESHTLPSLSMEQQVLLSAICGGTVLLRILFALAFSTTKKVAEKPVPPSEIAAIAQALERRNEAAMLGRRRLHSMESPLPQPNPGDLLLRNGDRERKKVSRSSSSYTRII